MARSTPSMSFIGRRRGHAPPASESIKASRFEMPQVSISTMGTDVKVVTPNGSLAALWTSSMPKMQ